MRLYGGRASGNTGERDRIRLWRQHPACETGSHRRKKAHPSGWASSLIDAWQFPTLAWGDPTLPSALRRFTSEFGMGSGGTTALQPPGKFCLSDRFVRSDLICNQAETDVCLSPKHLRRCKVKPHGSLVSVSSTYRYAYTSDLSTSSSSTFLQDP